MCKYATCCSCVIIGCYGKVYEWKKKRKKKKKENECKQPASGVTHAGLILSLRPYECDTNSLWSDFNGIHNRHGYFHSNIIEIIFIHDIPQIVLGRNMRLLEATDPLVVNKHEKKQLEVHLKVEMCLVPRLWGRTGEQGNKLMMESLEINGTENDIKPLYDVEKDHMDLLIIYWITVWSGASLYVTKKDPHTHTHTLFLFWMLSCSHDYDRQKNNLCFLRFKFILFCMVSSFRNITGCKMHKPLHTQSRDCAYALFSSNL